MIELTAKEQKARKMVCLPLDGIDKMEDLRDMVNELSSVVGLFKIGKETYTRFGPKAVESVYRSGGDVFLDLKYHDIPNTVKGAAGAASQLGVYMFNVHASGGQEMMQAAVEGARNGSEKYNVKTPKITAVTVLTSIDEDILNNQLRILGSVESQVLHLAQNANKAGLDGIVCSAADLNDIKDELPKNFMYVTPGIKGPKTEAGSDQKRVFTPGNAVRDGSSILVVGRAITGASDRVRAGYEVLQDMARHF